MQGRCCPADPLTLLKPLYRLAKVMMSARVTLSPTMYVCFVRCFSRIWRPDLTDSMA